MNLPVAHCGLFGIIEDYSENSLSFDQLFHLSSPQIFMFRAEGSSMEPFIFSKDILTVDRSISPSSGDIIVGAYHHEFLCKQIYLSKEQTILRSFKKGINEILVNDESFTLFGVVTGVVREMSVWKQRLRS